MTARTVRGGRAALVGVLGLVTLVTTAWTGWLNQDPFASIGLCFLLPGAVVVLRRDGHVIGWLLVASGVCWAVHGATEVHGGALAWLSEGWRAWLQEWVGLAQWSADVTLLVLFPDGLGDRSRRRRTVGWALIALATAPVVGVMLLQTNGTGSEFFSRGWPHPLGLGLIPEAVGDYAILPQLVAAFGAVVALWRRSRQVGEARRRQYSWVLFAFALLVTTLVFGLLFSGAWGDNAWYPAIVGWYLVPTAFSVAILRYRLYDIDRIISRTVAYGLTTAVVAAVFAVPVVALPNLFNLGDAFSVAAATLAAVAAFTPVRRRVQSWVDRHFNRARFDARRELDAFATRLRAQVDLDTVVTEIHTLVDTTLQPATASIWLRR